MGDRNRCQECERELDPLNNEYKVGAEKSFREICSSKHPYHTSSSAQSDI